MCWGRFRGWPILVVTEHRRLEADLGCRRAPNSLASKAGAHKGVKLVEEQTGAFLQLGLDARFRLCTASNRQRALWGMLRGTRKSWGLEPQLWRTDGGVGALPEYLQPSTAYRRPCTLQAET